MSILSEHRRNLQVRPLRKMQLWLAWLWRDALTWMRSRSSGYCDWSRDIPSGIRQSGLLPFDRDTGEEIRNVLWCDTRTGRLERIAFVQRRPGKLQTVKERRTIEMRKTGRA